MIAIIALIIAVLASVVAVVGAYNHSVQNSFNKSVLGMLKSNRNWLHRLDPIDIDDCGEHK